MGKRDAYMLALGEFISEFAWIEHLLFDLLRQEAGVDLLRAKALFSGVRIDAAKDLINRLHEVSEIERDPELVRAFAQIGVITRMRNDLVHYGSSGDPDVEQFVSNHRTAHTARALRESLVSAEILEAMRMDLVQISLILMEALQWGGPLTRAKKAEYLELAGSPWRYKPASPSPREKAPRKPPQARSAQPRSSRGKPKPR